MTYTFDDIWLEPLTGLLLWSQVDKYRRWQNDAQVTKYNSHGLFHRSDAELKSWQQSFEEGRDNTTFAIFYKGAWVGVCSLQSINWINRSAEVAIYVGEPAAWGKGIATMAVDFLLQHGFLRLGMHRIWSGTAVLNTGMNRVFEKLHFKKEGTFRDGVFLNGMFIGVHAWGILFEEWAGYYAER